MTVDRERMRQDVERLPYSWERTTIETILNHDQHAGWWVGVAYGLADAYLRQRDHRERAEEIAVQVERERDGIKLANDKLSALIVEQEAQYRKERAAVSALVEALTQIRQAHRLVDADQIARDALTAYEQAQEQPRILQGVIVEKRERPPLVIEDEQAQKQR